MFGTKQREESKDCCASREMTVLELLQQTRDRLIVELGKVNNAINEVERKDISNETARVLCKHL